MANLGGLSEEQRMGLTRAIMLMLDEWGLSAKQQITILGLPPSTRSRYVRQFHEDVPLPDDPVVNRRVGYLMGISEALRTMFPRNPEMGGRWIKQPNRRFGRRAPLAMMVDGGESGLIAVLAEVDCTFAWDRTGSKP